MLLLRSFPDRSGFTSTPGQVPFQRPIHFSGTVVTDRMSSVILQMCGCLRNRLQSSRLRKKIEKIALTSEENEENIWHTLIYTKRSVSPKAYRQMAAQLPLIPNPLGH